MLLSAVYVLVVAQSSSEIPEGLMKNLYKTELRLNKTYFVVANISTLLFTNIEMVRQPFINLSRIAFSPNPFVLRRDVS